MARTDAASLDPQFRAKVDGLLSRLRARGFQPYIANGWRTMGEQQEHFKAGRSLVEFSFHNAIDERGQPAALAADIADKRFGWAVNDANAAFFKALGAEARAAGLYWGGDWKRSNEWARYGMGWDVAHVQLHSNSALSQIQHRAGQTFAALQSGQLTTAVRTGAPLWLLAVILSIGFTSALILFVRRRRSL